MTTDTTFQITTPRLIISPLNPADDTHCDFMVQLYNTPEFIASIGGKPTSITTREAARNLLAGRFQEEHARNGYGTYLFTLRSPPSQAPTPIGTVGLSRGVEPDSGYSVPDLGFAILSEYMRKGYTKEAAVGLMEWAGREKGVEGVLGLHDPANEASAAVFRSLGFEDRGLMKLKVFGGAVGRVWTKPGMERDLSVYGLPAASGSFEH